MSIFKPTMPRLQRGHPLAQGLVGAWEFTSGCGPTGYDYSGYGHDAPLVNSPVWGGGRAGAALLFDGSTQYATINGTVFTPGNGGISVSLWVNSLSTAGSTLVAQLGGGNSALNFWINQDSTGAAHAGYWGFALANAALTQFLIADVRTNVVPQNSWTHLSGVRTGSATLALYRNGALDSSTMRASTNVSLPALNALRIASRADLGYYFNGWIDDVRIYNRALSAAEVAMMYQTTGP